MVYGVNMTPREIDALVAEHIMGFFILHDGPELLYVEEDPDLTLKQRQTRHEIPYYSENISAAWEVVERLKIYETGCGEWFSIRKLDKWQAGIQEWDVEEGTYFVADHSAVHELASTAICLAALKIKGIKI